MKKQDFKLSYFVQDQCDFKSIEDLCQKIYYREQTLQSTNLLHFDFEAFGFQAQIKQVYYIKYPDISEQTSLQNDQQRQDMYIFITFVSLLTKYIKIFGNPNIFIFDNQNIVAEIQWLPSLYYHVGLLCIHQDILSRSLIQLKVLEESVKDSEFSVIYFSSYFSLEVLQNNIEYKDHIQMDQEYQKEISYILLQCQSLLSLNNDQKQDSNIIKNKEFHNFSFIQAFISQQIAQKYTSSKIQTVILESSKFYQQISNPKRFSGDPNFLQIPFFLYFVFKDDEQIEMKQKVIQLLIDISYLHKIIHFNLSVFINESDHLSNNLLLHSSRSGKSTVCKSLYYFYMLRQNCQYIPFYFLCIPVDNNTNQPSYTSNTMQNMFNDLFSQQIKLQSKDLINLEEYKLFCAQKDNQNSQVQTTIDILLNIVDQNLLQFIGLKDYIIKLYDQIIVKYRELQQIKVFRNIEFQLLVNSFNITQDIKEFFEQLNINWFSLEKNDAQQESNSILNQSQNIEIQPLFLFDEVLQRHKQKFIDDFDVNNNLIQVLKVLIDAADLQKTIKVPDKYLNIKQISKGKETISVGEIILFCCPMVYYLRKNYRFDDVKIELNKKFFAQFDIKEMINIRNFEIVFIRDFQLNFKQYLKDQTIFENNDYLSLIQKKSDSDQQINDLSTVKSSPNPKKAKSKEEIQIAIAKINETLQDNIKENKRQIFSFLAGTDFSIHNMINFGSITKTSISSRENYPLVHLTYQGQAQFHPKYLGLNYYCNLYTIINQQTTISSQHSQFSQINKLFQFMSMNSLSSKGFTQLLSPVLQPQLIVHLDNIQFDNSLVFTLFFMKKYIYIRQIYDFFDIPLQIFSLGQHLSMQTSIQAFKTIQSKNFSQYFYANSQSLINIKTNLQLQQELYQFLQDYLITQLSKSDIAKLVIQLQIHFTDSEIYESIIILWFAQMIKDPKSQIIVNIDQIVNSVSQKFDLNRQSYFINSQFSMGEIIPNIFDELEQNFGQQLKNCKIQFIHPLISKDYTAVNQNFDLLQIKQQFINHQLTFIDNIVSLNLISEKTLFVMFIDSTALYQYIQLRNLSNCENYQTYKQADFLLKFQNFEQLKQQQFSSTLQNDSYCLLEYGPHKYNDILQKSRIVGKNIAIAYIYNLDPISNTFYNSFWKYNIDEENKKHFQIIKCNTNDVISYKFEYKGQNYAIAKKKLVQNAQIDSKVFLFALVQFSQQIGMQFGQTETIIALFSKYLEKQIDLEMFIQQNEDIIKDNIEINTQQFHNQKQINIRDKALKLIQKLLQDGSQNTFIQQYNEYIVNNILIIDLQIVLGIINYLSIEQFNQSSEILTKDLQYNIQYKNQFNQKIEAPDNETVNSTSLQIFMENNNVILLEISEKEITFLKILQTNLILQIWLNQQFTTKNFYIQQYLLKFQIFLGSWSQQDIDTYDVYQLFFINYQSVLKQISYLFSLQKFDKKAEDQQFYISIINNNSRHPIFQQIKDELDIFTLFNSLNYIFLGLQYSEEEKLICIKVVKLDSSNQLTQINKLFQDKKAVTNLEYYQKIIIWTNQKIKNTHKNEFNYLENFKNLDFSKLILSEKLLQTQIISNNQTVEKQIQEIIQLIKIFDKFSINDLVTGDKTEHKLKKSNQSIEKFLLYLNNFVVLDVLLDYDNQLTHLTGVHVKHIIKNKFWNVTFFSLILIIFSLIVQLLLTQLRK